MDHGATKRTKPRFITLTVLELLKEETDATRPLHISEIVQRLKRGGINTNRDTVRRVLEDLREFYPVRCEELQRGTKEGRQRYSYGYWYEPDFVLREAEVILDAPTRDNIIFLRRVLKKNEYQKESVTTVDFQFNGYGSDGRSHPTEHPPVTNFLPLKICMAYSHPYLIGVYPGRRDLAHIRIDLMTHLGEHREETRLNKDWENARDRLDQEWAEGTYLSRHLYMAFEEPGKRPRHITLRIKKWGDRPRGSLTFLHDAFGENITVKKGTESEISVDVEVVCMAKAVETFTWNYIDRVEVVGPADVKEQIEKAHVEKAKTYLRERGDAK